MPVSLRGFVWWLIVTLGMASVLAAASLGRQAEAQEAFFLTVADLPLMPGLEEMAGAALVFDNPGGRIVEVSAVGPRTRQAILVFYGDTLPQLGWIAVAEDRFEREGEVLRLGFTEGAAPTVVTFSISPGIQRQAAPGP